LATTERICIAVVESAGNRHATNFSARLQQPERERQRRDHAFLLALLAQVPNRFARCRFDGVGIERLAPERPTTASQSS